jgi:hypothetical protein
VTGCTVMDEARFLACVGYLASTSSLQVPPPVPTAALRPPAGVLEYGTYAAAYPAATNQPTSTYQPSQQQMFAPTPGTFTPDIYRYVVFVLRHYATNQKVAGSIPDEVNF